VSAEDAPTYRLVYFDIPAVNTSLEAPTLYLGISSTATSRLEGGGMGDDPTVRLALADSRLGRPHDRTLEEPTVRLAHVGTNPKIPRSTSPSFYLGHSTPGAQGDNVLMGKKGVDQLPRASAPALLISYVYLEPFIAKRSRFVYRDWALDSGAYSASTLGVEIDLDHYIETCRELMATDPTLTDIFALDVIGDWRASPWHSVDATNWELGPCKFGRWRAFKGAVSVRGSRQNLRAEVEYYLKLEARMRRRWSKEMARLDGLPPIEPPYLSAPPPPPAPRRRRTKGAARV
jgi:hypothetical protein